MGVGVGVRVGWPMCGEGSRLLAEQARKHVTEGDKSDKGNARFLWPAWHQSAMSLMGAGVRYAGGGGLRGRERRSRLEEEEEGGRAGLIESEEERKKGRNEPWAGRRRQGRRNVGLHKKVEWAGAPERRRLNLVILLLPKQQQRAIRGVPASQLCRSAFPFPSHLITSPPAFRSPRFAPQQHSALLLCTVFPPCTAHRGQCFSGDV